MIHVPRLFGFASRLACLPVVFALALALAAPLAAQTPAEAGAREAAEAWLAHLDAEEYQATWREAAATFQEAISEAAWAQQAASLRQQTGGVASREFLRAQSQTNPPGAPPGEYVAIQYDSEFNTAGRATEVVLLTAEEGRGWRVIGYSIQPPTGA